MLKFFSKLKNKKGFTLIELIVVVAILGILAAIAVPRLMGITTTAKTNATNATIKTVENALNVHEAQEGSLPKATTMNAFVIKYLDGKAPLTTEKEELYMDTEGKVSKTNAAGSIKIE